MHRLKLTLASLLMAHCLALSADDHPPATEITVYRSPSCGCCGKWIEHLKQNNFKVKDILSDEMDAIKAKNGVPQPLASCHTALVDGYVVEGHVPAGDVAKLLQIKPKLSGISAPGMPSGSPGMEMGGRQEHFQVVSFDKAGPVEVFAEHGVQ